jgi:DNA-binding transcriptional ArsR family regulator
MSSNRWEVLEGKALSELTPKMLGVVAGWVEELATEPKKSRLEEAAGFLGGWFSRLLKAAPADVRGAALGDGAPGGSLRAAYVLGQLGFASTLAAQMADRRVDEGFTTALRESAYQKYLVALRESDCSNVQLAKQFGIAPETVSRAMKVLREAGITDFRKDGKMVINSLTPVARDYLEEQVPSARPLVSPIAAPMLKKEHDRLPAELRQSANFALPALALKQAR